LVSDFLMKVFHFTYCSFNVKDYFTRCSISIRCVVSCVLVIPFVGFVRTISVLLSLGVIFIIVIDDISIDIVKIILL